MTSSVSVVRAWERHVSHTSSPIFTKVSDISAADGRGRRRSAGVSGRRWTGGCGALLMSSNSRAFFWERLRRVAGVACAACFAAGLDPGHAVPWWGHTDPVRLSRQTDAAAGPRNISDRVGPAYLTIFEFHTTQAKALCGFLLGLSLGFVV